jgi:putative two-component system response regulator
MYSRNGHIRILLIEDSKDDEELIRVALERGAGYKIVIQRVETESATLRALQSETWDIVLCDYLLPHFSANRALEIVREELADIPFIIVSGFEDEPTAIESLKAGANDFIYKRDLSRLGLAVKRELTQAGDRMRGRLEVEKSYVLTVEAWGIALERRDIYTKNHTVRVTDLTLRLARSLHISGARFRSIHYGALLHDVGKMGIPDAILLKRETLLPEEMDIMKMHPGIAFEMLSHIEFLRDSINIPYCHHEKWDGSGYPRGLDGDRIPFEARLFSICDVFDALTHDRPYRKSWTPEKAIDHLREEKGKSFDPAIVDKFIEVIR